MNKRHHTKLSTVALLLLPVLFLAGLAISLRGRPGAVIAMPTSTFSLVVNEVKFRKLPPQRGNAMVEITVYASHTGTRPKWWRTGASAHWVQNMRLVNGAGKEYPLHSFGSGPAPYDAVRQRHVLQIIGMVPSGYDITKPGSFKGTVIMANQLVPLKPLGIARFSVPAQFDVQV